MDSTKVGCIVMLVVGLLFLGGGTWAALDAWLDARKLLAEGIKVQGQVTRIVRRECSETYTDRRGRTQTGKGVCIHPLVSFPLQDGSTHSFELNTGSSETYSVGQQVPVIYLLSDPAPVDARIERPVDNDEWWQSGLVFWMFGAVFTLLPAGVLVQLFRLDARAAHNARVRAEQAEKLAASPPPARSPRRKESIEVQVIEISELRRDVATGKYTLKAMGEWRAPGNGKVHRFESAAMEFDPAVFASVRKLPGWTAPTETMVREALLGARLHVRVRPDDPANYHPELIRIPGIGPVQG